MNMSISIDCETYEELQSHLSEIKSQLKKRKKDILSESESIIRFEDSDFFGSHDVELEVFSEFERDIDRINNPNHHSF